MSEHIAVITVENDKGKERFQKFVEEFCDKLHANTILEMIKVPGVVVGLTPALARRGCSESHKKCTRLTGPPHEWTISEDDTTFPDGFDSVLCWASNVVPQARAMGIDILYGGLSSVYVKRDRMRKKVVKGCNCVRAHRLVTVDMCTGFFFYTCLTPRARLIMRGLNTTAHVDNAMGTQLRQQKLKGACVVPFIAKCRAGYSNIKMGVRDYSRNIDNAERMLMKI